MYSFLQFRVQTLYIFLYLNYGVKTSNTPENQLVFDGMKGNNHIRLLRIRNQSQKETSRVISLRCHIEPIISVTY